MERLKEMGCSQEEFNKLLEKRMGAGKKSADKDKSDAVIAADDRKELADENKSVNEKKLDDRKTLIAEEKSHDNQEPEITVEDLDL